MTSVLTTNLKRKERTKVLTTNLMTSVRKRKEKKGLKSSLRTSFLIFFRIYAESLSDIYRPDAAGEFPVLLMRQPYGRAIASTVVYSHPAWYAKHGYIVVIQDVRGHGTSEGEFNLFASETADGFDTVNWAANLPGSNGKVGMYGFSYQGITQLYASAAKPSPSIAICPAIVGCNLYADWAYEGGP
jgi:uncharacterized protein